MRCCNASRSRRRHHRPVVSRALRRNPPSFVGSHSLLVVSSRFPIMRILGIESSCDETGAAVVADGRMILADVVASQASIHERYGGVVPEVASRQQLSAAIPVVETALEQARLSWGDLDGVAATYGPGLAGSLLVGLTVGKTLALARGLPFIGVNHLEAHIYANWLRQGTIAAPVVTSAALDWQYQEGDPTFPLICLVISGAHSELVLLR